MADPGVPSSACAADRLRKQEQFICCAIDESDLITVSKLTSHYSVINFLKGIALNFIIEVLDCVICIINLNLYLRCATGGA